MHQVASERKYSRAELLAYVLQDKPVAAAQDRLGGSAVVQTMTDIVTLLDREDVFSGNIAIFAPWGAGKTSILSMVSARLGERFVTAWFDSWQYDNKPVNMAIGLLRKIQAVLGIKDDDGSPFTMYLRAFMKMSSSAATLMAAAAESDAAMAAYCGWIDQIDSFRQRFGEALKSALGGRRMVVFVDDLDRCTPHNVIFLLETIKNFLSVDSIVFMVAMDKEVVKETIDNYYRYRRNFGNLYLEKVFPYEFSFRYDEHRYHDLIDDALTEFFPNKEHADKLKDTFKILPYNPRRLKAILKKLFFQAQYYRGTTDDYERFLTIVLATYFPDFFDALCSLDERTALNLIQALVIFRELSEGLFRPEDREQQISKYPGMAKFFNDDTLLDVIKLMDGYWRFREPGWSLRIRQNERPLRKILTSIALE
ncbi:MAG: hypothetical protein HY903_24995 [Deltaproteobacteria bacterium]|nr:hypothetical protein [Deltaproteobacteria bacterium]